MVASGMSSRTPFSPKYDKWEPPDLLFEILSEKGLRTYDKVEIVFACYSAHHNGQGPYAREIADVLDIAKQNVERRQNELIAQGRARKLHGKFVLTRGHYTHPLAARFLDEDEKEDLSEPKPVVKKVEFWP